MYYLSVGYRLRLLVCVFTIDVAGRILDGFGFE